MSIGSFCEKDHQPSTQEILHALGSKQPLWEKLTQFISDNYEIPGLLNFGGSKYGWNLWYRKSGKTLVTLYPNEEYFVAQIVLGRDQAKQALDLKLGRNVQKVMLSTPQLHDGQWLFIKVRTGKDVKDIEQLLQIKKHPRQQKIGQASGLDFASTCQS